MNAVFLWTVIPRVDGGVETSRYSLLVSSKHGFLSVFEGQNFSVRCNLADARTH